MAKKPWILSTDFLKAIEEKNVKVVNDILDSGFDVDSTLMFSKNALNICVSNGWYDMAYLLIQRGCSLSLPNDMGQQPLTVAVLKSDDNLVKLLLDNRADRTAVDKQGNSALHYACELNNLKIVELLTGNAVPSIVNIKNRCYMTPLFLACEYGGTALVTHLISKDADVRVIDYYRGTALFSALRNMACTPEMVEALLNAGADVNHLNRVLDTALMCAMRTYFRKAIRRLPDATFRKICLMLIERGCNVNMENNMQETALHYAVHLNDEVLVRKLLNAGCEVTENKLNLCPLFYACQHKTPVIVSLLLGGGARTDCIVGNTFEMWRWYRRREHIEGNRDGMKILHLLRQSKKCPLLSEACRSVIRRALSPEIEKRALQLSLPRSLLDFILLVAD